MMGGTMAGSNVIPSSGTPEKQIEGLGFSDEESKKGFLKNCLIKTRNDENPYLFYGHKDGSITAHLDSYAIIPLEEYHRLKSLDKYSLNA